MWHRALIAASARRERKVRAFIRGAFCPLALTPNGFVVRRCFSQALIAWEKQKTNGVRKLSRLSARRARKRGGVPIIEVGVAPHAVVAFTTCSRTLSRSPLCNDESPQAIGSSGGNGALGDVASSSGNTPAARGRAKLRRAARNVATQLQALVAARRALALEVCDLSRGDVNEKDLLFRNARVRPCSIN